MITEQDLKEAIAECIGKKNPDASTCIKLAAFYTIKHEMYPDPVEPAEPVRYSYSSGTDDGTVRYDGESGFWDAAEGITSERLYSLLDELLVAVEVLEPRLYAALLRKVRDG